MDIPHSGRNVPGNKLKKRVSQDDDRMAWAETIAILVSEVGLSLTDVMNMTVQQVEVIIEGWQRVQTRKAKEYEKAAKRVRR